MYTWKVASGRDKVETIEGYETLEDVLQEMAASSWEDDTNEWVSFVVDEDTGHVVATGLFGPDRSLLVTVADGRVYTVPVPEFYRNAQMVEV